MIGLHIALCLQPVPRGIGVTDALTRCAHLAIALVALRSDAAGAEGIRKQHDEAVGHEEPRPFDVVSRLGNGPMMDEAAAIVQHHHRGEGSGAVGPVQRGMQGQFAVGNVDMFGFGGDGRRTDDHRSKGRAEDEKQGFGDYPYRDPARQGLSQARFQSLLASNTRPDPT